MKNIMKMMTQRGIDVATVKGGYLLIQIHDEDSKSADKSSFLLAHETNIIGEGSFGTVYKAYIIDPSSGQISKKNPRALKIIDKDYFDIKEHKIASHYTEINKPIYSTLSGKEVVILPQPFLGYPIHEHRDLEMLSPKHLLSLIKDLVYKVSDMHSNTLKTGIAVAHFDLKPGNILLNLVFSNSKLVNIEVNIIDYGLSRTLDSDDPRCLYKMDFKGNTYFPEETKTKNPVGGIKSDIWQLAGVLANLFGYIDNPKIGDLAVFQPKFSLSQLTKIPSFDFPQAVNEILVKFLNRMRDPEYSRRPASIEVLKFFQLLDNYYKGSSRSWSNPELSHTCLDIQQELSSLANGSFLDTHSSSSSSTSSTSVSDSYSSSSFRTFRVPTANEGEVADLYEGLVCLK